MTKTTTKGVYRVQFQLKKKNSEFYANEDDSVFLFAYVSGSFLISEAFYRRYFSQTCILALYCV